MYVSAKNGSEESLEADDRHGADRTFNAYFEDDELRGYLLQAGPQIVEMGVDEPRSCDSYATHPFIHAFARKQISVAVDATVRETADGDCFGDSSHGTTVK